jgi:hypothetical protein
VPCGLLDEAGQILGLVGYSTGDFPQPYRAVLDDLHRGIQVRHHAAQLAHHGIELLVRVVPSGEVLKKSQSVVVRETQSDAH